MRAVRLNRFGGPEVLEPIEMPAPGPGPGEVQIGVAFSEVLLLDVQLRRGWGGDYFDITPPFILGMGVTGVVAEVGPDVERTWLGRRVIGSMGDSGTYVGGGYAERAVAPVDTLQVVPDGLSLDAASAAISDGVMGVSSLERADLSPGDTVVVTAAAGGIATWLVPEAVRAGARVVAMARGAKGATARRRGAQTVVDYGEPGWREELRSALDGRPPAAVFDGSGGEVGQAVWDLTSEGSRFLSYGSGSEVFTDTSDATRRGVRVWGLDDEITPEQRHSWTGTALGWLAAGRVEPVIGQRLPLAQADEAHAAIEARTVAGKTLLVADAEAGR